MHEPANAQPFAGFEQSGHAVEMNALQGVARGVLQSAGAIDDGIDAPDMSQPGIRRGRAGNVEGDPANFRHTSRRTGNVPRDARHLMPLADQPRNHRRADQPGRSRHQNTHFVLRR